jgi:hypothetical protein
MLVVGFAALIATAAALSAAVIEAENLMFTSPSDLGRSGGESQTSPVAASAAPGAGGPPAGASIFSSAGPDPGAAAAFSTAGVASAAGAPDTQPPPFFPPVEGDNLEGKRFQLPNDFEGERNIVLIAFQRGQQAQVDTWVPFLRQLAVEQPGLRYYELPTIKEMGRVMRWVINSGMARGIEDAKARAATITLFIDKGPFIQALSIRTEEAINLVVVDRAGRVYWQTIGTYTPEKERALREVLGGR